mmetsp:Transcript_65164/g.121474  ORF Transcript_65164/g.121474 Transcript_65164/m.121474 type:complete len:82 (-) Transcript_65164:65-310(-)
MPSQVMPFKPAVDGISHVHAMMLTGNYSCKSRAEFMERPAGPAQPCQVDRIQRRREAEQKNLPWQGIKTTIATGPWFSSEG